jgi:hypothetical protein
MLAVQETNFAQTRLKPLSANAFDFVSKRVHLRARRSESSMSAMPTKFHIPILTDLQAGSAVLISR